MVFYGPPTNHDSILPHAIVVRLIVRKINAVILTPETAGTVGA